MADYKISQLTPVTPTSDDLLEVSHTTDSGVTFNTGSVSVDTLSSAVADNITAADIEYSSGVSVADKIDDLARVTTGQLTKDSNVIGNVEVNNWVRKGNIVEFHITATLSADIGNTTRLFYGLPTPLTNGRFIGLDTSTDKPFRVNLNSLGELSNWYTRSADVPISTHIIEMQGTYICQ